MLRLCVSADKNMDVTHTLSNSGTINHIYVFTTHTKANAGGGVLSYEYLRVFLGSGLNSKQPVTNLTVANGIFFAMNG